MNYEDLIIGDPPLTGARTKMERTGYSSSALTKFNISLYDGRPFAWDDPALTRYARARKQAAGLIQKDSG